MSLLFFNRRQLSEEQRERIDLFYAEIQQKYGLDEVWGVVSENGLVVAVDSDKNACARDHFRGRYGEEAWKRCTMPGLVIEKPASSREPKGKPDRPRRTVRERIPVVAAMAREFIEVVTGPRVFQEVYDRRLTIVLSG